MNMFLYYYYYFREQIKLEIECVAFVDWDYVSACVRTRKLTK